MEQKKSNKIDKKWDFYDVKNGYFSYLRFRLPIDFHVAIKTVEEGAIWGFMGKGRQNRGQNRGQNGGFPSCF
jgi:hypothetical protein